MNPRTNSTRIKFAQFASKKMNPSPFTLDKLLFPMLSAWLVLIYIHLLQYLCLGEVVSSRGWLFLLFIPVVFLEFVFTRRFRNKHRNHPVSSSWWKIGLPFAGNVLFWFACFRFWVILICAGAQLSPGLKCYGPQIHLHVMVLWRSMQWFTIISIIIWIVIHYVLTIRWRRFRILTSVVFPVAITVLMFLHQFHFGGVGGVESNIIEKQVGVEQVLGIDELRNAILAAEQSQNRLLNPPHANYIVPKDSIKIRYHPRGIIVDESENAVFIILGCTYCTSHSFSPMIVRKDLTTGNILYVLSTRNVRQIEKSATTIFIAPWRDTYIYELSKSDLSVIREIPCQVQRPFCWEPMSVLKDVSENRIYIANEMHPAILSYDLETGSLIRILNLQKLGLVDEGGAAWCMVQSKNTRRLYFIAFYNNNHLFEVNPDTLQVIRYRDLGDFGGTALILDDENGVLYYQSGFFDSLYRINIEQFKVERKYQGEFHARRIRLDKQRNVLYVLGYTSGTVFPIDLESGEHLWEVRVGGRPHGMALSGDALWVNSMAGAFRLDLQTIWKHKGYSNTRFDLARGEVLRGQDPITLW